ncbi:hypothetical protein ACQP2F_12775 [Actinoplanes sp. CA-030573]|uniref:hypothetical protein n=1 Tax=Actinoplanes sp. CA-030573 TaxID=3239898 RepID=UPI003D944A2D
MPMTVGDAAGGALVPRWSPPTSARPAAPGTVGGMTEAGLTEVTIAAGTALRRCLARRSDLVLYVVAGHAEVFSGATGRTVAPGEAAVCARGRPWQIRSRGGEVRLLALAVPAGPEAVLRALARSPALDDATLLALAVDGGVELLLPPLEA